MPTISSVSANTKPMPLTFWGLVSQYFTAVLKSAQVSASVVDAALPVLAEIGIFTFFPFFSVIR